MPYRVRRLTEAEANAVAEWRYDADYDTYDGDGPIDPRAGYFAIDDPDGVFVGFCCFGAEARVPGIEEEAGVLDLGVGMGPAFVGGGRGGAFVAAALAYGRARYAPERFRAVIHAWNHRSLAVCANVGFERAGVHVVGDANFVIIERPAS